MDSVVRKSTGGGRHSLQRPLLEVIGDKERNGMRKLREAQLCKEGRDGTRATDSNKESKQTQRRTLLLTVGDAGGWLLYAMLVLHVDVGEL